MNVSNPELSDEDSEDIIESQLLDDDSILIDTVTVIPKCRNQFVSADGTTWTYQVSIIDYLQRFNMNKKMEVAA